MAALASSRCRVLSRSRDCRHFVAQIEPHIQGDLVVAAARRVQLAAGAADLLGQPALDVHVNVFIRRRELELAAGDLALDGRQAADNFLRIPQGNNPLLAEHLGMGDAAHDVMAI